jgi:ribosome biogenesis GTPase / thiamine phosphate phosphatase
VPEAENLTGLIVGLRGGHYAVHTDEGRYVCRLRGRLKRERLDTDLAALGDRVRLSVLGPGVGDIEEILPRGKVLSRRAPGGAGRGGQRRPLADREQVLLANPDQAVFVFAAAHPAPHLGMLDRFLVIAEAAQLPAAVCVNKVDLVPPAEAQGTFGLYERLGYRVLYTSALEGVGLETLRDCLRDRISVLAGPSGVGKSSLLNALQPGLGLAARAISRATRKGRHTTVAPELLALDCGGWVADTPGLRALAPWDMEAEEMDGYFVDIGPLVAQCEFNNCSHVHEAGCAVRAAVAAGQVAASRYDSYLKLRSDALK